MEFKHIPVLLHECIDGLNIKENGIYVDGTLGGAGHSSKIVEKLSPKGILIGIDRDEDALKAAKENLKEFYEQAKFSKELVTICTEAEIPYEIESAELSDLYTEQAYVLCKEYEFKNFYSRFEGKGQETVAENWQIKKIEDFSEAENIFANLPGKVFAFQYVMAKEEVKALAREMEGEDFELMPWDWAYYSRILKEKKFNIDEEILRPYFELNKVIEGVFGLATRLYGITFQENKDIPVYHTDVKAYEVYDKDNSFLAVLYTDFHPRASKRSGAWMTNYKEQWIDEKGNSRPHVSVAMNFTKPSAEKPALLTFGEVTTFLHEFGHALHGILAKGRYPSLTGTSVSRDFVELPSQIMENWAYEPEYLNSFAKHYQTGEPIPAELIEKIVAAKNYLAAYAQVRQLHFGYLDMAWHSLKEIPTVSTVEFEQSVLAPWAVMPAAEGAAFSCSFSHIFSGGYSAGYYSYKWAEVLEADAFSLFKEKGIFNTEVSGSFRENILSKGGTEEASVLYRNFRGHDPEPQALMEKLGLVK